MTEISSIGQGNESRSLSSANSLNDLDLDSFLKLMITELRNQDPLNPLDNKDMLAQISQIREVGATDKLTETLESVLLGQNIASATNLIGAHVSALSDDNQNVAGLVERVTLDGGKPKLHVALPTEATPSSIDGHIEEGTYSYRIIWKDQQGVRHGIELSGENAVSTTGTPETDTSIMLNNLPVTPGTKEIYRTDRTGAGIYRLVGVVSDGAQNSFVDVFSDEERFGPQETGQFQRSTNLQRKYTVSMNNVSEIRPPS